MLLSVPAIWWWTGASAFNATVTDLCVAVLPYTFASLAFNAVYSNNRLVPLLSDINHLVSSMGIIRAVFDGLFRPNGRPFKVTAKGVNENELVFHWSLMAPFAAIACATLSGMIINLGLGNELRGEAGYQMNVIWSLLDTVMLSLTCLACVDQPRRRVDERFRSGERAVLLVPGARPVECTVFDISLGGAALECPDGWPDTFKQATLWMDDGRLQVPILRLRVSGSRLAIRFSLNRADRSAMILKLFDRRYSNPIDWVNPVNALGVALRRLMA
jgi:cellulose synthase (UDP-forming)